MNETCSSSGNSVTISCPLRNTVPRSSSMRLNSSKKWGAVARPRSRKHVNSDKLPSVSKRMPPSKFRMSLWPDFSFFFGFCCWVAREAGTSNSSAAARTKKSLGKKRPISVFQGISAFCHRSGLHQERDAVNRVQSFSAIALLGRHFPGADGFDGGDKFREHGRLRHRDVVGTKHEFQIGSERREALRGCHVGVEIGFRAEEPNGGGIVRVAGKKQPVGAIEQTDGVRRVARRGNNFQLAAAPEIDLGTVVNLDGDSPGFCGIRFWVKSLRQIATELIRRDFGLGVFART